MREKDVHVRTCSLKFMDKGKVQWSSRTGCLRQNFMYNYDIRDRTKLTLQQPLDGNMQQKLAIVLMHISQDSLLTSILEYTLLVDAPTQILHAVHIACDMDHILSNADNGF